MPSVDSARRVTSHRVTRTGWSVAPHPLSSWGTDQMTILQARSPDEGQHRGRGPAQRSQTVQDTRSALLATLAFISPYTACLYGC
eukprot:4505990-Pyramimonas_sp.AAC.1